LLPENIPCLLRAQRLAAIGAALPARPDAPPVSPSRLRAVLKHPLIADEDVRAQEDPYDDVYVEEVAFHGGSRLVLQGLTNHSAHTVRVLLNAIFGSAGAGLPGAYARQARLLTDAVLSLSHAACGAAGLWRGVTTTEVQRRELFVPGQARLGELRSAVTFTAADLSDVLKDGALQLLEEWITDAGTHPVALGDSTDDGLILRPLLRHGTDLIVVNPGELASALRHHLIVMAAEHGCREALADAFRQTAAAMTAELLTELGAIPRGPAAPTADPLVLRQGFDGADGTIIDVGVLTDDLSGYDATDPFGVWSIPNVGQPLQDCLDPPGLPDENDDRTLRLAVTDDVARIRMTALEPPRRPGPLLTIPLDELQVMIGLDADDPLFLWQFARASDRFHENSLVQEWSVLDTYAIYRDNNYSFYLSDDRPPTMISVAAGSGAKLRAEVQRRHDPHHIPGPGGQALVEVRSLYGTDTAPICFPHPRHGFPALAVELAGTTAWVLCGTESSKPVRGFLFSMLEGVAYWIWQLGQAQPGLLAAAARPDEQLQITLSADDSARWSQLLAGGAPDGEDARADGGTATAPWVTGRRGSPGEISIAVIADHAGVLRSGSNLADRQLVAALVCALEPGAANGQIDAITAQIAPVGPKRMIHIVQSSDILLTPTDIPARTVQPAVTATVLDDLGQWLADQGLDTGKVPPGERTTVLGQAVEYYYTRLTETVADLSPEGLMGFLVSHDEALVHDSASRVQRLPSQLACFGATSLRAQDLLTAERKGVEAAVASRFLVEYAAAVPPAGNRAIDLMIYDELLAVAAELISRATLSDAIHYGFSQVQLSRLPSGRLGVSQGDRYSAGTEALAMAEAEARHALALEPEPGADTPHPGTSEASPAMAPPMRPQVDDAMRAEFGFTLTQAIDGLAELAALSAERGPGPCTEPVGPVHARLRARLGWEDDIVTAFLGQVTLRPRAKFLSPRGDAYPWRYNRDLSYIRRPVIEVLGPGGEPLLMWGARRTWFAARYWAEVIFTGRLKASSPAMTRLMGTIRQDQNKAFEREVAAVLRQSGMPVTASAVKQVNGRRLLTDGADLGDIDAVAIDPASKIIIVAEAKDFELARTPAELANEAEDLLTGDKSAVYKLGRRAEWVRRNLSPVLRHFGAGSDTAGWRVLPVIVTSRNLLSPRVLQAGIPVLTIADLSPWVRRERTRQARRRRH
jgi:hypothetical protein